MQFSNSRIQPFKKKRNNATYYNIICIGQESSGRKSIFESYKKTGHFKTRAWNNVRKSDECKDKDKDKEQTTIEEEPPPTTMGFLSLVSDKEKKSMDDISRKRNVKREQATSTLTLDPKPDGSVGFLSLIELGPPVSGAKVDGSVGFLSLLEKEVEEELIEPIPPPFSSLSITTTNNNIANSPSTQRKSKYSFNQANHQINVHYVEEFAEVDINTDDFVGFIFVFCVSSRDSFAWIKKQMGMVFKLASSHSAIVLGSKCDELRVVSFSEADALAKKYNLPYIECSAKEQIQVEESIADILYQLEYEYDDQINWDNAKREIKEKLSLAVLNRNIKKIKSLVSKEQPNVVGRTGWAPIHVACWEGSFEIVFIFLQVCPQCNATLGKDNWTPLHIASRMGFVDITHLLLNSGANVFDKDSLGRTAADGRSRKQRDLVLSRIHSRRRNQSKDFSIRSLLPSEMESSDLDLSYASLSSIPQEIFRFPNLTWLSFSHCGLTSIDPLLCECKQLHTLILSVNSIIQLPDQISQLSNLEHIDLRNNRITSLPLSFGEMKSLKRCYLSYNLLSYLPSSMENFEKSIEALDLYGNPLNTLPPDLVPKLDIHPSEMPHLFAYLRDIKEGQQEYNRIKIMLVGDGNVGKTSLGNCFAEKDPKKVHRLSTKLKKKDPTDTIATDGIDISEVVIPLVGKDIVWDVWDYAGQEIYYTTHQFFLTKRAIYLVIFNLLDRNLARVEYWLNSIHTRARGSPIILVGTHSDSKECTEEYLTEFTNNLMKCIKPERFKSKLGVKSVKAIYFVSSRKRLGIKDLMDGIKDTVAKQKWEGQLFPSSWVKLEEAVTRLKRSGNTPFFQWIDFKRMAETVGIPPNSVKDATLFLHTIGCLCYFDEEVSGLNEIVIIDPQFLTNVMSSIITLKHRFGQAINAEGILLTSQLPHIWKDFPSDIHPMLLKLMESFEIFFRLPSQPGDDDQRIVIPSLLSEIQPNLKNLGWNISLGQKAAMLVVGRVYNFEFLPLGFFPRLFVRNFHIPNVQITSFWRHGMLIEIGDTKSLLRFNPARYRLTLEITSSSTSFHESVKLLRLLVENIESTIEGWYETKVEILVPCPHCVSQGSYDPWKFSINECLQAITKGIGYVLCQNIRRIRLDLVAPDLSFVDFQRLVIPYESLQMEVVIGQGGFGTVYKGVISDDPSTLVAIKQLSFKNAVSEEAEYVNELKSKFSEFQREVWIMSCLKHNNVCGLIAITNNPMTMIIDYLPMGDLFRLIDAYPRIDVMMLSSMELKLKLIFEIAKGIHHLHSLSPPIIHRDLRSPNIFILSLDIKDPVCAKIGDFGLSRLISSPLAGGDFNANWLAPEVMKGDKYDHKLDVYSFGIIMWEILSLKKPFEEYDSKYAGKPKNMFYSDVIAGLRPTIPLDCDPDYHHLMIRCWDGQPSARPEFRDIIQSIRLILIKYNVPFPIDINNEGLSDLPSSSSSSLRSNSPSDNFTDTVEQMEIVKLTHQLTDPIHPQSIQKLLTVSEKDEITLWTATASGDILIWDSLTLNFMMQFRITKLRIYDMVSMNGEVWVATNDGSIISVSTSKDHKILYTIYEHSQSVRSLAKFDIFSTPHLPFGSKKAGKASSKSIYSIVLSGDLDGTVNIWRTQKRKHPKLKNKFKVPQPVGAIIHKGETIYIGTDGPVYMFDIITNTLNPVALNGHTNLVTGMIFASQHLWTCSNDGSLRIWDINNNTCLQELKAHSSKVLCISSIGSYVFTGSFDMILAVWDSKSGELLQELKGVHKDGIRSILTLGDTILTGGLERDPVVCVWKLTGRTGIRRSLLSRQRRS